MRHRIGAEDPRRLLPAYDTGDHLHPNPAGYRALAEAVPLRLLRTDQEAAVPDRLFRTRLSRTGCSGPARRA